MEPIPTIELSTLPKTWVFDLDGTLMKHNGHLGGCDKLLPGTLEFLEKNVREEDYVLILTARDRCHQKATEDFLIKNRVQYDTIIFGLPTGERLLFNDKKPSGLTTAHAFNVERDRGLKDHQKFEFKK